jgi:putative ABC transport system permease protein
VIQVRNLLVYIGFRHLKLKPGRALLTTAGIASGVALFTAIAVINHSTRQSLRESVEAVSGKAKLTLSGSLQGFDENLLERVRIVPGVKAAVPLVSVRAFFEGSTESADGLSILGVDLLQEASIRTYKTTPDGNGQRVIDDPLTFLNQPDSIVITKALATKRHLGVDSSIRLTTPTGLKTFIVRGILEPEGAARAYGGSLAIMDIDGARVMFGKEGKLDRIDIVPRDGVPIGEVRARLEKLLGRGFTVSAPDEQADQTDRMVASYQLILTFFSVLALLVGLFLVMSSVSVAVAERRKEIGILRALGASRASMVATFVGEAFAIGLAGSILGCALGKGLAGLMVNQVTQSVAAQIQTALTVERLELTFSQAISILCFGTLAATGSALVPALQAAKVHPLESMKKLTEGPGALGIRQENLHALLGLGLLAWMRLSQSLGWAQVNGWVSALENVSAVLGTALFGPFLAFVLIRGFRASFRKSRILVTNRRRTESNVAALIVGLFLVMLIATVRTGFQTTLGLWLDRVFVSDLIVASSGNLVTGDVQPVSDEIEKELRQVPGVREVGHDRGMGSRLTSFQYQGKNLKIKAYDRPADFYGDRIFDMDESIRGVVVQELYRDREPKILATEGFLTKHGFRSGDAIELATPSGQVSFRIIGTVTDFASPEGVLYLNRQVYKKYWKDPLVNGFIVNAAPGFSLEQVRTALDARLGRKWNVIAVTSAEFRSQMREAIDRTFAYTKAIEWVALLVALLGLMNALFISVMERTREIGTLRAIGMTRAQAVKAVFLEALVVGFTGSIIAIAMGTFIGKTFVEHTLTLSLGWKVRWYFPWASAFTALLTGPLLAAIAAVIPARRAARLEITKALDYE